LWPFGKKSGDATPKPPKPAKPKKEKKSKQTDPIAPAAEGPIEGGEPFAIDGPQLAADDEPLDLDFADDPSLDSGTASTLEFSESGEPKIADDDAIDFLSEDEDVPQNGLSPLPDQKQPSSPAAGGSGKKPGELSDADLDEFLKGF
jgi:hypothetical protein